ncbi:hypothetical protein HMPREF9445_02035 [Bacteroides clarus YIT 12056]|uniref:Toxin-antitoxin system, toxin component domain protein n=1 Tax=Bacteroides clarus YIT 12056 TaxID=762984 RepID=A0ABP2KPV0_9BACE|nr:hypothetical protein HMPREF9445_02035 [Bacteroides clarus YIT 12056]
MYYQINMYWLFRILIEYKCKVNDFHSICNIQFADIVTVL